MSAAKEIVKTKINNLRSTFCNKFKEEKLKKK